MLSKKVIAFLRDIMDKHQIRTYYKKTLQKHPIERQIRLQHHLLSRRNQVSSENQVTDWTCLKAREKL